MKKAELILGAITLIALVLNLFLTPYSGVLTVLSLSALSAMYMYFSFALFNGVRLRHIFKKASYKEIPAMRIVGAVLTGFALAATIMGLLFKIQYWPGANVNLAVGVIGLAIVLIVGAIKYSMTKSKYYTGIFKRIAVYGGLGLILLILPRHTWLEFKYRNHPGYVEAFKKAMADPDNQELWDKVDQEQEKWN